MPGIDGWGDSHGDMAGVGSCAVVAAAGEGAETPASVESGRKVEGRGRVRARGKEEAGGTVEAGGKVGPTTGGEGMLPKIKAWWSEKLWEVGSGLRRKPWGEWFRKAGGGGVTAEVVAS